MAKRTRKTKSDTDTKTPDEAEKPTKPVPTLRPELLEELLAVAGGPAGLTGKDGLLKQLTAALVNKALEAEMSEHLGYEAREEPPDEQTNRRNGHRTKKVRSNHGVMDVDVPRDRAGSFEPKLVGKHQRTFDGFDDKILSMYARGMSTRDIRAHLHEIYGVDVSPDFISRVTLDGHFKSGHTRSAENRPTGVGPRHASVTPSPRLTSSLRSSFASFEGRT